MEKEEVDVEVLEQIKILPKIKNFKFPVMNRVAVAGKLIHDPPIRWTKRGVPVTNFIIATKPESNGENPPEGLERESCLVSVVVWSKQALQCNKFLKKGSSVLILGELQSMPNSDPENDYNPVQLSAQWIQYLEKDTIQSHSDDHNNGFDDQDDVFF